MVSIALVSANGGRERRSRRSGTWQARIREDHVRILGCTLSGPSKDAALVMAAFNCSLDRAGTQTP
jgi:hypothetical protein